MTLFKENSNGENHIKNTKRASRSSNANKTTVLLWRSNYLFIVGYCCWLYTHLLSPKQPYALIRCLSNMNSHKFFRQMHT